jgi:hypothetical protein
MSNPSKVPAGEGSDSDDEFRIRKNRKLVIQQNEYQTKDILAEIVKLNLNFEEPESDEIKRFYTKYRETLRLQGKRKSSVRDPGNILHVLAKDSAPNEESEQYWNEERLVSFMHWILNDHHDLLEGRTDARKDYPLFTALQEDNHTFIRAVLQFNGLKNVKSVLSQINDNLNYIHFAVLYRSPLVELFARKCAELALPVWNGPQNRTPLNAAVSEVFPPREFECTFSDELLTVNPTFANMYQKWKQEHDIVSSKQDVPVEATNGTGPEIDKPCPVSGEKIGQLLLRFVDLCQQSLKPISQVEIVKLFIDLSQDSLERQCRVPKGPDTLMTPYQERIYRLKKAYDRLVPVLKKDNIAASYREMLEEDVMRMVVTKDPVAEAIRYHCLRHFDRDKIVRCLYQPGDERHIDFDLAGLRTPKISNAFLKRLAKHLRFESILKYVALPKLALEDLEDVEEHGQKSSKQSGREDASDLRAVFQWLRDNNVQRILRVTVVDYGSPCHSDSAIQKALKGFHVEIWDWKKVDLCTDVIADSTSEARHVSLYSSCNNAVLMGWASSDGLGNRTKFSKLEHVRLFIAKGQEGDRRAEYIEKFEKKIEEMRFPNSDRKIKVEHHLDDGKVSFAADFNNNEISEQQEIEWISKVKGFSTFMRNIPRREREKIPPIKIAVIDDGVDASLEFFIGLIAGGKSFCPYSSSSDLMNAYYVPSGQHGTMMADLIRQICPSCRLYVARLDERPSRSDSSRQITMESAAEAVKWAVDCRVDIISMSWTIDGTTAETQDVDKLDSAIAEAKKQNILMICSTSDNGSFSSDNYYPAKSTECMRIGAATALGDKCTWVPDQHDYLLPGKNIPFKWVRQDGVSSWYESGSSLATALAAGLAGLLLYCDRAVNDGAGDSTEWRKLRSKNSMTNMFRKLAISSKEHKFVRPDIWFDLKFRTSVQDMDLKQALGVSGRHKTSKTADAPPPKLSEMQWSETSKEVLRSFLQDLKSPV